MKFTSESDNITKSRTTMQIAKTKQVGDRQVIL